MKEMNDFLLNLFTGTDELRPKMNVPNLDNGIVYASDARVLISIPEDELSLKYGNNPNFPNCKKLIDEFESSDCFSIKVKVADIAKELVKARITVDRVSIKCNECGGSGEVEWEYWDKENERHYEDRDCPICEGEGAHETDHKFARVSLSLIEGEDGFHGIDVGELHFHPFQLYRLFMVAFARRCEEIEIFYNTITRQTITYFGNIKVLVMLMIKP